MTTRSAWSVPWRVLMRTPSCACSIRRTSDRSNTCAPAAEALAEDADTRAIRIELRAALRQNRTVSRRCRSGGEVVRDQATRHRTPTAREVHTRDAVARPLARWWRSRRHPRLQIATDAQTLQQRDQLIDRLMAQLPDPPAGAGTIPLRQLREFEVRFLQQERRARGVLPLPTTALSRTVVEMPADAKACATKAPVMPPPTTATAVSC